MDPTHEPGTSRLPSQISSRGASGGRPTASRDPDGIHGEIPLGVNVAFLVDGVYHPGDAYPIPGVAVQSLLMPVSGPWEITELGIDFIRAVQPAQTIQIHDALLNDLGKAVASSYLGATGLTGVPMITVGVGHTITI